MIGVDGEVVFSHEVDEDDVMVMQKKVWK